MSNEWRCQNCGGTAKTRKERRMHKSCPLGQMERVQRAMAFQDAEWVEEVHQAALAGSVKARKLFLQKGEADRDYALLQKMYKNEESRMAALGQKLDGTPIESPVTDAEITTEEGETK